MAYNPFINQLSSELKESIQKKHKIIYNHEIDDRIKVQNEKLKLIGGYQYWLAIQTDSMRLTAQEASDFSYIKLKDKYKRELNSYIPTDHYMFKVK